MDTNPMELARRLASAAAQQRARAAEILCQNPSEARTAAVALVQAASDEDEQVRELVCSALEDLGQPDPADVPQLADCISASASPDSAYWAATLLGRLGPRAGDAVPQLTDALANSTALHVRQRAAWALGEIGPAAASAVPTLQEAANSDDARLARLAKSAVERTSKSVQSIE